MIAGKCWAIYDYIDHRGENVVLAAINGFPISAKAAINLFVANIEVTPPPLDRRLVKPLKDKNGERGKGLYEFRVNSYGVQYRPIVWYGPESKKREMTILAVAVEQNGRFVPSGICQTCWTRIARLQRNEAKYSYHDFS